MDAKHRSLLPLQLSACLLAGVLLLTGCSTYQDAPAGVVKGVLIDSSGDALAQCSVSLMATQGTGKDQRGTSVDNTDSDSSGAFTFENVQSGKYSLGVVTSSGSAQFPGSVFTVRDGKGVDLGELRLK